MAFIVIKKALATTARLVLAAVIAVSVAWGSRIIRMTSVLALFLLNKRFKSQDTINLN